MTRQEAEKLVGTRVEAWTSCNGIYVGILEAVVPQRYTARTMQERLSPLPVEETLLQWFAQHPIQVPSPKRKSNKAGEESRSSASGPEAT